MKLQTLSDQLLFPSTTIDGPIEAWGLIETRLPANIGRPHGRDS